MKGILLLVAVAAALVLTSCGSRQSAGLPIQQQGSQSSIQQELAQLKAYPCPEGVDDALWLELKEALQTQLTESRPGSPARLLSSSKEQDGHGMPCPYKSVATPPTGNANRVNDLAIADHGDGSYTLTWHYRNLGDYGQNGKVGIEDITPLAVHYGETWSEGEEDSPAAVIDGSGNGKVDIADVTAIAVNFQREVHHYTVQGSHLFNGPFVDMAEPTLPEGTPAARVEFTHDLGEPPYLNWRVVPYDSDGNAGPASNVAVVSEAPPPAVRILSINPLGGVTGAEAAFTASVVGDPPLSYAWDFGGGAAPNESAEASPTVTLGAVGTYPALLTVENEQGSATRNFTLTVSAEPGEPPQIISVTPTGGDSGTEATFTAEVTGDGPLEYAWNFGGGASPNQSTSSSPIVTLSRGGTLPEPVRTYPATLTVANPSGTDVLEFNLDISAWWHRHEMDHLPEDTGEAWDFTLAPDGSPAVVIKRRTSPESGTPCEVYYYRWKDGDWHEELVDNEIRGQYVSLAFDPQGRPGILLGGGWMYQKEGNKYLHFNGSTWTREEFDETAVALYQDLDYYPNGNAIAVYTNMLGRDLVVATRAAQGWEVEPVVSEDGGVDALYLQLDDSGTPHIAYGWSAIDDWGTKYVTKVGGNWVDEWIAHGAGSMGLALDPSGRPATSYWVDYSGRFFTTRTEAGWHSEFVDELEGYGGIPLIDSAGVPIMFRYSYWDEDLLLSYCTPTGWITEPFLPEGSTIPGAPDVLLTPEGNAAVRYTIKTGDSSQIALDSYW